LIAAGSNKMRQILCKKATRLWNFLLKIRPVQPFGQAMVITKIIPNGVSLCGQTSPCCPPTGGVSCFIPGNKPLAWYSNDEVFPIKKNPGYIVDQLMIRLLTRAELAISLQWLEQYVEPTTSLSTHNGL
jgi:hypothetical protein